MLEDQAERLRMPLIRTGESRILAMLATPWLRSVCVRQRLNKQLACLLALVMLGGCASNQQLEQDWQNEKFFVKGIGWLPRAEAIELRKAGHLPDVEGLDD